MPHEYLRWIQSMPTIRMYIICISYHRSKWIIASREICISASTKKPRFVHTETSIDVRLFSPQLGQFVKRPIAIDCKSRPKRRPSRLRHWIFQHRWKTFFWYEHIQKVLLKLNVNRCSSWLSWPTIILWRSLWK